MEVVAHIARRCAVSLFLLKCMDQSRIFQPIKAKYFFFNLNLEISRTCLPLTIFNVRVFHFYLRCSPERDDLLVCLMLITSLPNSIALTTASVNNYVSLFKH
jgi:hypothetical protein